MSHLVSAIMPVHNGERFLWDAVASIRQQDYAPLEIIVVDDGSTDGTPGLIGRLGSGIVSVRQPRRGPAAARNRGLRMVHGQFIAFLDADDLWPTQKLRDQVSYLLGNPALDVVLGRVQPLYADCARDTGDPDATDGRARRGPVVTGQLGSAVFRREIFERVGCFDERLRFSEDHDWFLRAREQDARLAVLEQVALLYRRHGGNITRRDDHQGYQLTRVLKASLDRRRAQGAGATRSLPSLSTAGSSRLSRTDEKCERT